MAELEQNQTPEPQEAPKLSATEQRAMEQGWVPQDQWQGDPDDWRPAKEYIDRGELLRSISELKRENRMIREGVQEFKKHHEEVKRVAYKQALADLRAKKLEALDAGDHQAVVQIDEKIAEKREELKAEEAAPKPAPVPNEPHPAFVQWENRNGWYKSDRAMKAVADEVARDLIGRGEQDPVRILSEVDKEVRKAFPHQFENPRRSMASAVEGTTRTARVAKDDVVMTDVEKSIMNKVLKTGVITKEEYLKEFKARQAG